MTTCNLHTKMSDWAYKRAHLFENHLKYLMHSTVYGSKKMTLHAHNTQMLASQHQKTKHHSLHGR